jgi:hypothetical protein
MSEFTPLFDELRQKDLACRYDPNTTIPPQVETLLIEISRLRRGFRTLNDISDFPLPDTVLDEDDTAWVPPDRPSNLDYNDILKIRSNLLDIGGLLNCPVGGGGGGSTKFNPCPELGDVEDVKKKLEKAEKWTDNGSKAVKDPKVKRALERAKKVLNWIVKHLGKVLKGRKYCALLKELLESIDRLDKAKTPEENAKAFDDLFQDLFKFGEELLPPPFDEFAKSLKDTTLFEDMAKALPPDQRWKEQFEESEKTDPTSERNNPGGNR